MTDVTGLGVTPFSATQKVLLGTSTGLTLAYATLYRHLPISPAVGPVINAVSKHLLRVDAPENCEHVADLAVMALIACPAFVALRLDPQIRRIQDGLSRILVVAPAVLLSWAEITACTNWGVVDRLSHRLGNGTAAQWFSAVAIAVLEVAPFAAAVECAGRPFRDARDFIKHLSLHKR